MTSFKPLQVLVLAGILGAATGCSMAQPGPATGDPGGHGGPAAGGHMHRHDPAKMQAYRAEHMAARLAEVKTRLKITPAQEAAWTSYTAALQPTARAPMAAAPADLGALPTPERLDRMRAMREQHMAEMTQQMDQRANATKTFYAVLSPEQKKIFDDEFSRVMRQHGGQSGHAGHQGHPMMGAPAAPKN
jgi:hypothetical protein